MTTSGPENVPERQAREEHTASFSIESYQGPLPPPEYLRKYEEAVPGTGVKIVDLMVSQANHRAETERSLVGSIVWLIKIVPILNVIMGVLVVGGGLGAIYLGESVLGRFIFGIGGLQAGVGVFAVLRSALKSRADDSDRDDGPV